MTRAFNQATGPLFRPLLPIYRGKYVLQTVWFLCLLSIWCVIVWHTPSPFHLLRFQLTTCCFEQHSPSLFVPPELVPILFVFSVGVQSVLFGICLVPFFMHATTASAHLVSLTSVLPLCRFLAAMYLPHIVFVSWNRAGYFDAGLICVLLNSIVVDSIKLLHRTNNRTLLQRSEYIHSYTPTTVSFYVYRMCYNNREDKGVFPYRNVQ